jgi:hypothetical protein
VRAEVVVLGHAAPVGVDHGGAVLARADAVLPVVLVGEAAPRPTEHRDLDLAQGLDHIVADASRVGDRAVRPDPVPAVDAMAQVFREVPIYVPIDGDLALIGLNSQLGCLVLGSSQTRRNSQCRDKSHTDDPCPRYCCHVILLYGKELLQPQITQISADSEELRCRAACNPFSKICANLRNLRPTSISDLSSPKLLVRNPPRSDFENP